VGDIDTALGEELFDVPEAQRETKIEPDRMKTSTIGHEHHP
jgi:hypothetical protein